jgi:hypothetical protein
MAASAWTLYNSFKQQMADGTFDLDNDVFYMSLHTSASNAATNTLGTYTSVTGQVTNGNGYVTGGKSLTARTWAAGASAGVRRFDCTANVWSATAGDIASVRYAVIRRSGGQLMAVSALSTGQFTVTGGNTLTVTPSANGIFELT